MSREPGAARTRPFSRPPTIRIDQRFGGGRRGRRRPSAALRRAFRRAAGLRPPSRARRRGGRASRLRRPERSRWRALARLRGAFGARSRRSRSRLRRARAAILPAASRAPSASRGVAFGARRDAGRPRLAALGPADGRRARGPPRLPRAIRLRAARRLRRGGSTGAAAPRRLRLGRGRDSAARPRGLARAIRLARRGSPRRAARDGRDLRLAALGAGRRGPRSSHGFRAPRASMRSARPRRARGAPRRPLGRARGRRAAPRDATGPAARALASPSTTAFEMRSTAIVRPLRSWVAPRAIRLRGPPRRRRSPPAGPRRACACARASTGPAGRRARAAALRPRVAVAGRRRGLPGARRAAADAPRAAPRRRRGVVDDRRVEIDARLLGELRRRAGRAGRACAPPPTSPSARSPSSNGPNETRISRLTAEPEMLEHLLDLAVLALAQAHGDPGVGALLAVEPAPRCPHSRSRRS